MDELLNPIVKKALLLAGAGLAAPVFSDPIAIAAEESEVLSRYGISIKNAGTGNSVVVDSSQMPMDVSLNFASARESALIIGKGGHFNGTVSIRGTHSACCFASVGSSQGPNTVRVNIDGNDSYAYFGKDITFVGAQFLLEGDGCKIVCGDDCMFSWGIFARNYDSHSIFDLDSLEVINRPTDLIIGSHVWIGQDVLIAKGVSIGTGSIVGARSAVFSDVSACCAVGGVPAKVIRSNISWTRMRYASGQALDTVRNAVRRQE